MLEKLLEHLRSSHLIPPHSKVIVGYSGGADSTCLVHMLHRAGTDVIAAHLHHGQRAEADDELNNCTSFCQQLDIPFISGKADVPRMAKDLKIGLEEAGREARYEFLQSAAKQTGSNLIATAHTRDDHIESVLLHIVRGSGLAGLAGIPEQRGNIVRPMLIFTREQTRAYCKEHELWTHDDPANTDRRFSRARLRLNVLPELKQINPEVEASLSRLADIAGEENEFLDSMAAAALERCEMALNGELGFLTQHCEVRLERQTLAHLPPVLMKRAFRLVAGVLGAKLNFEQTNLLADSMQSTENGAMTAEGGHLVFEWNTQWVHARQLEEPESFRVSLVSAGEVNDLELGWSIRGWQAEACPTTLNQKRAAMETDIDIDRIKGDLYARNLKPGDAMQPLGFTGRRKVADLMSEAGLTVDARKRLPVVCDMLGPVWVPAVCMDDRVRIEPGSKRILHLKFGPAGSGTDVDRNGSPQLSVR